MTEPRDAPAPREPAALETILQTRGLRYLALSPLGANLAHLRFPGPYRGRTVVWDATLYALDDPAHAALRPRGDHTQFMEVGTPDGDLLPISLGVAVSRIDAAVAERVVIMVQKYKRLPDGRHEYGTRLSRP